MRPPEPSKIASYAFVLNKVKCPGKDAEGILGTIETHSFQRPGGTFYKDILFQAKAVRPNPEANPKWLPQVLRVIEASTASNPDAKSFVEFSRATAAAKTAEAKPAVEAK